MKRKTIKNLKMVGYWNEILMEDRYIFPQEIVLSKISNKSKIVKYLKGGSDAIYWKGYSWCRFCKKTLGTKCLTDGTWVWPEKLEHYISKHNVSLPQEFINHMENNKWKAKKVKVDEVMVRQDNAFWVNWCKEHKNPRLDPINRMLKDEPLPQKIGDGKIELHLLHDMYSNIESLDLRIDRVSVDSIKRIGISAKDVMDKTIDRVGVKCELWGAELVENQKHIIVENSEYDAKMALCFKNNKPHLYTNEKGLVLRSKHYKEKPSMHYCSELDTPSEIYYKEKR